MTVLTACQTAARRLKSETITSLFTSPTTFASELVDLANESATSIAKSHDWRVLTKLHTITGDGSDTSFALPTDYDRMPNGGKVYSTSSYMPLRPVDSVNQWLEFQIDPVVGDPGFWIILGGEMQIKPAIGNARTAKFYYISNKPITTNTKTAFTADADTFDLPERLLTLDVIWRWQHRKGLPAWQQNEELFNQALALEIGRDKGSRVLFMGTPRYSGDVNVAYPGTVSS